jgi:glutathione-regulated potassium-efflux system ancillary protein KefF
MIVVIYAHPYPRHSRASEALVGAIRDLPGLELRSLYDLYPDFDIDVGAEQAALEEAGLVVWLHPTYWYTVPGMMKHWFDEVLLQGWAFGGRTALAGKACLWVTTTGGDERDYSAQGSHGHPFRAFEPVVEQTARYCGMEWLEPFVVHAAHRVDSDALEASARALRSRLEAWMLEHGGGKDG